MINALSLVNEVNDRLGWPQLTTLESAILTSEQRKMLTLLNRTLQTVGGMHSWPLLRKDETLVQVAADEGDTTSGSEQYVTATQNSTTVTIANGDITAAAKGMAFQVAGDEVLYRIESVDSATQLTLNRAWVNASITAADEQTFCIAMDQYSLSADFDRPVDDWESFLSPYGIKPLSPDEFREKRRIRGGGIELGEPLYFTIYGINPTNTAPVVHFEPFPKNARLLYYPYQASHPVIDTDDDIIRYPDRLVEVIIEAMVQQSYQDYEDDGRMQQSLMTFLQNYNQALGNPTVTGPKLKLSPSGRTRMSVRRAYGVGSRLDWGDFFDRAGNAGLR